MLGIKLGDEGRIKHVYDGTPAQDAGLSAGDVLVALDGLRATAAGIDQRLARYRPGDTLQVHAFRRDELMQFRVKLATRPPSRWTLTVDAGAPRTAAGARRRWLTG
jgi:predicted metalloprotease with PDZ domain